MIARMLHMDDTLDDEDVLVIFDELEVQHSPHKGKTSLFQALSS